MAAKTQISIANIIIANVKNKYNVNKNAIISTNDKNI